MCLIKFLQLICQFGRQFIARRCIGRLRQFVHERIYPFQSTGRFCVLPTIAEHALAGKVEYLRKCVVVFPRPLRSLFVVPRSQLGKRALPLGETVRAYDRIVQQLKRRVLRVIFGV